jgi:hypothetical protein
VLQRLLKTRFRFGNLDQSSFSHVQAQCFASENSSITLC